MGNNRKEQAREEYAVNELVESYGSLIRRVALRVTRDEAEVEDIVQDVFLRLLQYADRPQDSADLTRWIYVVAKNAAIRHIRRDHLVKRALEEATSSEPAWSEQDALEEGERPDTDLLSMLRQTEERPDAIPPPPGEMLNDVVQDLSKNLKLYEQVHTQLEEVDEIIQRLGRDREEIDRLKEETRSNISELQRMIAA